MKKQHQRDGHADVPPRGRSLILELTQDMGLPCRIIDVYSRRRPWTLPDTQLFIQGDLRISIARITPCKILARDDTLKLEPAIPMDDKRVDVTPVTIQTEFSALFQTVECSPVHFIFN
jgi:hypothetical protein